MLRDSLFADWFWLCRKYIRHLAFFDILSWMVALNSMYERGIGIWNTTWLLFGASLLLGELHILHSRDVMRFGVPVFFIVLGIYLLFHRDGGSSVHIEIHRDDDK